MLKERDGKEPKTVNFIEISQWLKENRRKPLQILELIDMTIMWKKSGKGSKKLEGLSKKAASIEKIKQKNLIGLEALLDEEKPANRIMKAEIKRQSGDFQEALKYLSDLPEESHWISEQMKQEIDTKNTKVFEIKYEE